VVAVRSNEGVLWAPDHTITVTDRSRPQATDLTSDTDLTKDADLTSDTDSTRDSATDPTRDSADRDRVSAGRP
jgi:hypothetical protein